MDEVDAKNEEGEQGRHSTTIGPGQGPIEATTGGVEECIHGLGYGRWQALKGFFRVLNQE
jgi:hypothetical protein